MNLRSFCTGINAKLLAIPVLVFCVGLLVPGTIGYLLLQRNAERESHEKALMLLHTMSSTEEFMSHEVAPHLHPGAVPVQGMGSFVTRHIMQRYATQYGKGLPFRYREVAINPTNTGDRPDLFEAQLIATFAMDHHVTQIDQATTLPEGRFQVVATPITVSDDRCLSCHGLPSAAPPWRVHTYGHRAGFGWKKGAVIGASLVYVPTGFAYAQAGHIFWSVFEIIAVLALLCAGLLVWRAHYVVARPAVNMMQVCQAIPKGDWTAKIAVSWPDEMASLAQALQNCTLWLRQQVAKEEKLRALFQQFIPASVAARALGKDGDEVVAGTCHPVTVMIINIRNFKLLMEHLPPEQTVTTLNEFFGEVNRVIVTNRGVVSKYLGDTVMAIFGMPLPDQNHALYAVRAALAIPPALHDLYVRLDEKYGWELGVGIGISTGEPIVGHFGSSEHMEYSVLGDVVGDAHRLEDATKAIPEEDTILISETTYRLVMSDVHVYDLGERVGPEERTVHAYVVQGFRSEARKHLAA